jgi:hypothetical protein
MDSDNLTLIRKSFKDYFSEPGIELHDVIELGIVRGFDDVGTGWTISYKLKKAEDLFFLDFFAEHRMTNSRHHRILENGEVIALESLWEFGSPQYDDDPERTKMEQEEIWEKNKKVEDILKQKGLM